MRALDNQLKVTHVCISSYVDFKRECLIQINSHNFGQNEDDNMETQSSLDDDQNDAEEDTEAVSVTLADPVSVALRLTVDVASIEGVND